MKQAKKTKKLNTQELERLAELFRCFSEATRLALLQELKHGPQSVNALVSAIDGNQANVSKQLKLLHQAGLIDRSRDGNSVYYAVSDPFVMDLCALACGKLNDEARKIAELTF